MRLAFAIYPSSKPSSFNLLSRRFNLLLAAASLFAHGTVYSAILILSSSPNRTAIKVSLSPPFAFLTFPHHYLSMAGIFFFPVYNEGTLKDSVRNAVPSIVRTRSQSV